MTDTQTQSRAPRTVGEVVLAVQGLSKSFKMGQSRLQILDGVDVAIRQNEFVAIEGRSGSGKSTLLHLMGLLDEPDSGTVIVNGRDVSALSGSERCKVRNREIGFVFQFYHLLPELSVIQNTLLAAMVERSTASFIGRRKALYERAESILLTMGLKDRMRHRPSQLSGGERQRVAIARALMNEPRILLADEPTGNLDFETGQQIMTVLNALHDKGQTVVMVTHDRTLARQADRVLVLTRGRLATAED